MTYVLIDKNRHIDRNVDYEIKRQKSIKQELGSKVIRIDADNEYFDTFMATNEIFRHIKQLTNKTLANEISTRLLGLEFKSENIIKSKATKVIVEKTLPDYK